jgi:hypothetical protein
MVLQVLREGCQVDKRSYIRTYLYTRQYKAALASKSCTGRKPAASMRTTLNLIAGTLGKPVCEPLYV